VVGCGKTNEERHSLCLCWQGDGFGSVWFLYLTRKGWYPVKKFIAMLMLAAVMLTGLVGCKEEKKAGTGTSATGSAS
jgi:hypothetical protein